MMRCIHLIPVDGLGGVEAAARSYINSGRSDDQLELKVMYLARPKVDPQPDLARSGRVIPSRFASVNNPLAFAAALYRIVVEQPDMLICSLWRDMLVGIPYKVLFPGKKLICFLHNTDTLHLLDKLCNAMALLLADAVWSDSKKTLERRVPEQYLPGKRVRVISFVLERYVQQSLPENAPSFVFWGRLHSQKGIDRALRLFAAVVRRVPAARFDIYGPDDGEGERLRALAAELGLTRSVAFKGPTDLEHLRSVAGQYAYYLQLSRFEGMAISVVEGMQLGLLPVVTPVGEIPNYCSSDNAIIVYDADDAEGYADAVVKVLDDQGLFCRLQSASAALWNDAGVYSSDLVWP